MSDRTRTDATRQRLVTAVADATRSAVRALLAEHVDETFYYFSLITNGEGHAPQFVAWSKEALDIVVAREGDEDLIWDYRWSYAESPYYRYGNEYYAPVRELWATRGELDPVDEEEWELEVGFRIGAMVDAMELLDREGLFGDAADRTCTVINVEWMPPDAANVLRARRLNPPESFALWLADNSWLEDQ